MKKVEWRTKAARLPAAVRIKALLALVYGVGIPLLFWTYTRSSLAQYLLLAVVLPMTLLHVSRALARGPARVVLSTLSLLATAAFGASVLIGIIITPFSAYKLWFEAMAEGTGTGTVSNLFTLLAAFFSTTLGATFISMGHVWPLLLSAAFVSALAAVILQVTPLYLLTLATGFACVCYLLFRGREGTYRLRRALYAGGLFAAVLLCAAVLSGSRAATGSRFIDVTLHPQLRQYVSNTLPQFPLLYGIPGYGYSFQERSLGGSPVLSPLPIFRITADVDGPLYLKTDVFDHYDGRNWKTTFKPEHSIAEPESILLRGRPRRRTPAVRVELLIDFYNKLPYTLDASVFRFGRNVPALDNGHFHRGFQLVEPLVAGDVLFIERGGEAATALTEDERRRYLQLPPSRFISREVRAIAASFEQPAGAPREHLDGIANYLADTCTYSLNVDNLRRSENFLDKFLFEEKKGYCVHFATAFTTMARLNGYPARYNTGFLVNFPAGKNETDVTGLAAHSWPEVWLEDAGWTRWEATPAVSPSAYSNFFDEEELLAMYGFDMEMDYQTLRQVQSILGDRELDLPLTEEAGALAGAQAWSPWQIGGAVAGALLLALLGWRLIRRLRAPAVARELRPLIRLSQRYVLLGRTLGVPDPRRTGWVAWREAYRARSARRAPGARRLLERFTTLVAQAVYGGRRASARDLRFIRAAYWRLLRYRLFGARRPPPPPAGAAADSGTV